jgi:hypothetical protein
MGKGYFLKNPILFFAASLFTYSCLGQQNKPIYSLNDLFAGIPLGEPYANWIAYVNHEPGLGIDSTSPQGIHSSIKLRKFNFPFPDTVKVKVFLRTGIKYHATLPVDTICTVSLSAIFGATKVSRNDAETCLKEIKTILKPYYKTIQQTGITTVFGNGISSDFPEFFILAGRMHGKKPYFLSMTCSFDRWSLH